MNNKVKNHILVVDDDESLVVLYEKIIETAGMVALSASNIKDATQIIVDKIPHVIFLDINLEGKKSFGLLKYLKSEPSFAKIPVIMISSDSTRKSIMTSMELGATDFLSKPITPNSFLKKIRATMLEYELPVFTFDKAETKNNVSVKTKGDLILINEFSMVVRSNIKFHPYTKSKIKADYLDELGADFHNLNTTAEGKTIDAGLYDVELSIHGLSPDAAKRIRNIQAQRK